MIPFLLNGLIAIVLLSIAYQDFKDRAVYWWLYAALFLLLGVMSIYTETFGVEDIVLNLSFLVIQYLGVMLYFSVKKRKLTLLLLEEIGLGDVLYILSIAFFLTSFDFLIIYGVGLFSALLWFISMMILKREVTIPLAGVFSLVQIILLGINWLGIEFLSNL